MSAYISSNTADRSAKASSATYLIVRSGWSNRTWLSTSMNANMLAEFEIAREARARGSIVRSKDSQARRLLLLLLLPSGTS